MQGRGVKVRVLTSDGQHIEGWFYSQNSLGFYISLDPQGRNIRFISQRDLSAIGYHRDAPKADFADGARPDVVEAAAEFERETGDRIITILERIDYNRVQRAGKHLRSTRFSLRDIEMQIREGQYTPGIPDTGNLLEIALETHEAIRHYPK